ncbi:hypothetical protein [Oryza sativa Japonica Group]|nr:hypothetical protein [Oryza sativa Japonica Group]BAD88029.1 hypothetical protein [Oryza sativa Japonica Group]
MAEYEITDPRCYRRTPTTARRTTSGSSALCHQDLPAKAARRRKPAAADGRPGCVIRTTVEATRVRFGRTICSYYTFRVMEHCESNGTFEMLLYW